jgi:multidrug efflux pump subunit AcrB
MSASRHRFRPEDSWLGFTVRRPVAILMVTLAVSVFGWVSYQRLALTLMPDMSYPTITVRTTYPGTAPEEIENVISRPLEQALGIIPRLASISSISKAGQSDVVLEFQWDTDMDVIAQEVREKVDRIRLPDTAERPLLLHYDPSLDPVLRLGLAGPQSLYDLRHLAEHEIKRRLEALPGVAAVKVKGGLEEEFLVALDENKIATLNLDVAQISQRLQQGNVNMPGGNLREGQTEYLIRTLNEFRTIDEIGALIITRLNDRADVRLRDIATVSRFHKDREVITRVNGRESVEIEVYKEADANVVAVAATVRRALFGTPEQQAFIAEQKKQAEADPKATGGKPAPSKKDEPGAIDPQRLIRQQQMADFIVAQLPAGASLDVLSDQSIFINNSIQEVKSNAVVGALIAVLILYLFLRNFGQTVVIGLTIPVSIVATFAPMFMADVSLNIISLGGLALGVGMLVDNAIVVLESIFRCREEGDDLTTAVVRGTSEVGMAVIASTLTTVAVFFPIVFVEGVAGQVFGDMALTVVFSLLASLVAALFLIPMLASRQFGTVPDGVPARMKASAYLQFPTAEPGRSRLALGARCIGRVVTRLAWAVAVMLAAIAKLAAVSAFAGAWPIIWALRRTMQRWRGRPSAANEPSVSGFARVAEWSSADRFGPVSGERVWPGLLALGGLRDFGATFGKLDRWVGRQPHWRSLFAAVPAFVAVGFIIVRFVVGGVLRVSGTLAVTSALAVVQAILGLIRLFVLVAGPATGAGLSWFERGFRLVQDSYPGLLRGALRRRGIVLGSAVAAFLVCWFLLVPKLGRELIPQVHQGEFTVDVTLPIGTPLERTAEVAGRIEEAIAREPEVDRTALTAGAEDTATTSAEAGEHTARITVRLKTGTTSAGEQALIERIRGQFRDLPEVKLEVSYPTLFSFKNPIEIEVRGHDLTLLKRLSREAEAALSHVPGLVDVRSTLQAGHPEIQIVYHRDRLAEYGLNLRTVADLIRTKVQGRVATEFRREDRLIDIVVRLREQDRLGLAELSRLIVNPGAAVPIPLSAIAELRVSEGPNEIRRIDQQRAAVLTGNIRGADLATVTRGIVIAMETLSYPTGFSYVISGQNQEMQRSLDSLLLAFALALFLVYIVMASQFESLVQPLLIIMTVPLALIGVVLALWLTGIAISIMVFLGLIILAGIVVNNAIVLVDYINTLRSRGLEKSAAIIEAGRARLRPILMTTLTTVLGLMPMALGLGEGAEIRAPMAITVIVGLSVSTLLTLVVIPTLYYQFGGRRGPVAPEPISTVRAEELSLEEVVTTPAK